MVDDVKLEVNTHGWESSMKICSVKKPGGNLHDSTFVNSFPGKCILLIVFIARLLLFTSSNKMAVFPPAYIII